MASTDSIEKNASVWSNNRQAASPASESIFTTVGQSTADADMKVDYGRNRELWLERNPEPKGFWNWLFGKHKKWEKEYLKLASSTWETTPTSEYEKTFLNNAETTTAPQVNNPFTDTETTPAENNSAEVSDSNTVRDVSGLTFDDYGNPISGLEKELNNDGNIKSYTIYADGEATKKVDYEYYPNGKLKGFHVSRDLNESDYNVKNNNNNLITVEDKNKTTVAEIDLNTLLQVFEQEDKDKIAAVMSKLPAEALMDLYNENITFGNFYEDELHESFDEEVAAFYRPSEEKIYLRNDRVNSQIIMHELGHAIDYKRKTSESTSGIIFNWNDYLSTTNRDDEFSGIFDEELEEFKKAGYSDSDCYGATSAEEAFAEAYVTMYGPESVAVLQSKSVNTSSSTMTYAFEEQYNNNLNISADTRYGYLLQYFPRTLCEAERLLNEARQLPQEKRGEAIVK